jgi:tetratricopeptide (TPR) repeat protein
MNRVEKRRQRKLAEKAAKNVKPVQSASPIPGQQTLAIQEFIDLAVQHHNEGRLPEAESIYQQILQDNPNQPDALHLLGVIAHQVGKNDIAVDLITKAIAIKPDFAEAHNNLGNALRDLRRLDEAVASFHKALAIKPDYANAYYNLGNALHGLERLDEAVASYQQALAIKPDYSEAHNNLGISLQDLGCPDEAVANLHKALAINPENAEAHSNLGSVFKELGRLDEALASYHKALAIKPDCAKAHNDLGNALQDMGKRDEAVASYHKALALKPGFAEAQYSLGTIYKGLGQEEKAITFFKEAGIRDSEEELLGCLYKSGKFEEFNENLQVISKKKPASALVSSLSVHASINFKQPDNYNFCKKPLDFSYQNRFECLFENDEKLIQSLLRDIRYDKKNSKTQSLLKLGEQSSGNLFNYSEPSFACLPDLIMAEIERYRAHFKGEECLLISQWPQKTKLKGWYVRMKSGGHLDAHMHQLGWVSGTIYLSLPENVSHDEGRIELGLHGNNYPLMHENFPTKTLPIKIGDIVLFPSSTFHRTIPFRSDEERISIAFDLIPLENL